jgi:hypothetical protein
MSRKHLQTVNCELVFSRTVSDKVANEIAAMVTDLGLEPNREDKRTEWFVVHEKDYSHLLTETIISTAWAFKPEFLAKLTGHSQVGFEELSKSNLCENLNEFYVTIINLTCGMKKFVDTAVETDGPGHYLASYDGIERKYKAGRVTYFIYRSN